MGLSAIRARRAAAVSIWPRWRRRAWMRGSKGTSDPRAASVARAPVTTAERYRTSASNKAARALAVENCVPLSIASPSLGPSTSGARPASWRAVAARTRPLPVMTSPTPIITAVRCDKGARSPDAPTEPCEGMTGTMSWASMASSMARVSSFTPDAPWARLASLSAIISRVTGTDKGSPTPAACDRTMLR